MKQHTNITNINGIPKNVGPFVVDESGSPPY
jgi:hypothetical protein